MLRLVLNLKRVGDVGTLHELVGIEQSNTLTICPFSIYHFFCTHLQQLNDAKAVLASVGDWALSLNKKDRQKTKDKKQYTSHFLIVLKTSNY